jgi:1A family penicillin-binding protein
MRRIGKYTRSGGVRAARLETNKYLLWFRQLPLWQKIAYIAGPILIILILIPLLTYLYFARDISNKDRLMNRNNTGIVLLDKNKQVLYQVGRAKHRDIVPLDQISDTTKKALLASEDKNFYNHGGFSVTSLLGALYGNVVTGGSNFGGSTLTQQLAKNTLLSDQKTFLRKYQELSIAIAIDRTYSKDDILSMYLNSVYFGENAFGIEDAAETYFGKKPADLTLAESAMLIGLLPAPSAYSPISGSAKYAKERQTTVLTRMVNNKVITEAEKTSALAVELQYAPQKSASDESPAPHFSQMVIDQLKKKYGDEAAMRSGYQVTTTLDVNLQKQLQQNISDNMKRVQANGGSNASGVAIDPTTGNVLALVGSADWENKDFGKVNMVTTPRQPGSSFKPIYYARGLADGVITPATILEDKATDFDGWRPKNALNNFNGNVSVRKALDWSLNIPAIKVLQKVGVQTAVSQANTMGISTIDPNKSYGLSLALGSAEARLLDMTGAYSGFANKGSQLPPQLITEIQDKYSAKVAVDKPVPKRVISEQGAYLISNILSDNSARAGMFGSSLNVPGHRAAVKTGTTDENRDAWAIGYTPRIAVGIWVGNNDNATMGAGGGSLAGPIWRATMSQVLKGASADEFTQPSGIVQRDVCSGTGLLARNSGGNTYKDIFLTTALPDYGCNDSVKKEEPPVEQPAAQPQPAQQCPSGTTGTYPDCKTTTPQKCPTGTTGTYPDCKTTPVQQCPAGTTGTYPDCKPDTSTQQCPTGTTGTYPNCTPATNPPSTSTGP